MTSQPAKKPSSRSMVFVIDDDQSILNAVGRLLRSVLLDVQMFSSPSDFLTAKRADVPSCLILDVRLPGQSGFDVQAQLLKANIQIPIVMMTGYGDIPMSVRAMKAGAIDFLSKPFRDQDILDAVTQAIEKDKMRRETCSALTDLRRRFDTLSPREAQILELVTRGLMNKQVASEVGLSEITVKIHRRHVMQKLGARTLADLVRMDDTLKRAGTS